MFINIRAILLLIWTLSLSDCQLYQSLFLTAFTKNQPLLGKKGGRRNEYQVGFNPKHSRAFYSSERPKEGDSFYIARKDLKFQQGSGFHLCLSSVSRLCGPSEKDMQSHKKHRKLTVSILLDEKQSTVYVTAT